MAANWIACQVTPLKKQVHPGWGYNRLQDPTREKSGKIGVSKIVKLLEEMFQNMSSWPIVEQVCAFHLGTKRVLRWKGTR
jgi:hypothetical protein